MNDLFEVIINILLNYEPIDIFLLCCGVGLLCMLITSSIAIIHEHRLSCKIATELRDNIIETRKRTNSIYNMTGILHENHSVDDDTKAYGHVVDRDESSLYPGINGMTTMNIEVPPALKPEQWKERFVLPKNRAEKKEIIALVYSQLMEGYVEFHSEEEPNIVKRFGKPKKKQEDWDAKCVSFIKELVEKYALEHNMFI